jgi:uroporphyrinogen decarboxylase
MKKINSLQRTIDFIEGKKVDRIPFHPILMQFAAKYAGVNYRDFCINPKVKCEANIKCARELGTDWVNVMSDPYAEAEAYGRKVEYPIDSLPLAGEPVIKSIDDVDKLKIPLISEHERLRARIKEIELYREMVGDEFFIVGWVEGPLAEYCDIRDMSEAMLDFYIYPEKLVRALDITTQFAREFITAQVKAGAHCIGIGDAVCSQISPDLYQQFVFEREKVLVQHAHSLGVKVKLHICGNTSAILPDMIKTGADIIDIDHLVGDMSEFVPFLSENQVFSGNSDPVSVIQDGRTADIYASVEKCFQQSGGRGIISAGCEVPKNTSLHNFEAYVKAAHSVAGSVRLNINSVK